MPEDAKVAATAFSRGRGKYITLVLLLIWVAALFGYTVYRFIGMAK